MIKVNFLGNAILMGPNGLAQGLQIYQDQYLPRAEAEEAFVFGVALSHIVQGKPLSGHFQGFASEDEARAALGILSLQLDSYHPANAYEATARDFSIQAKAFSPCEQASITGSLFRKINSGHTVSLSPDMSLMSVAQKIGEAREKIGMEELANAFFLLDSVSEKGIQGLKAQILQCQILLLLGRVKGARSYFKKIPDWMNQQEVRLNLDRFAKFPDEMYPEEREIIFAYHRLKTALLRDKNKHRLIGKHLEKLGESLPPDLRLERAASFWIAGEREKAVRDLKVLGEAWKLRFEKLLDLGERYKSREKAGLTFREHVLRDYFDILFCGTPSPQTAHETLEHLGLMKRYYDKVIPNFSPEEIQNVVNQYRLSGPPVTLLMVTEGMKIRSNSSSSDESDFGNIFYIPSLEDFAEDWEKARTSGNRFTDFYPALGNTLLTDRAGRNGKAWINPGWTKHAGGHPVFFYQSESYQDERIINGDKLPSIDVLLKPELDVPFVPPGQIEERLAKLKEKIEERFKSLIAALERPNLPKEDADKIRQIIMSPLYTGGLTAPISDPAAVHLWARANKPFRFASQSTTRPIKLLSRDGQTRFYYHPRNSTTQITPEIGKRMLKGKWHLLAPHFSKVEAVKKTGQGEIKYILDFDSKTFHLRLGNGVYGFFLPYESESVPYAIRIIPELRGTLAGELVRYHEAIHVMDILVLRHFNLFKMFFRKRWCLTERERVAYFEQGTLFRELNLTANDLRWMEVELRSKGLDPVRAKKIVTHLSAPFWVDDVGDAVEVILDSGAILDSL